jgi:hypothetical protein
MEEEKRRKGEKESVRKEEEVGKGKKREGTEGG